MWKVTDLISVKQSPRTLRWLRGVSGRDCLAHSCLAHLRHASHTLASLTDIKFQIFFQYSYICYTCSSAWGGLYVILLFISLNPSDTKMHNLNYSIVEYSA